MGRNRGANPFRVWISNRWIGLLIPVSCLGLPTVLHLEAAEESASESQAIASRVPLQETGDERDHMTGDWGGWRTWLVEHGVHFRAGYSGEVMANLSGGLRRGAIYEGLLEMGLDVDPSRFSRWQGATFHVSALYPHGKSPTEELVGDLSTVSNIDAKDAVSLFEWWYQQRWWSDRISWRIGQLAADEEFAFSEHGGELLNATFGWPSFMALNTPAPAYPIAALGTRLRWDVNEVWSVQAAAFDGNPDPGDSRGRPVNKHGTRLHLDGEEGLLAMAEIILHHQGKSGKEQEVQGIYKLGGWLHTGDFAHMREDTQGGSLADPGSTGMARSLDGNWGVYAIADQWLWRETAGVEGEAAPQGLGAFVRLAGSPEDRNLVGFYADAGLRYQGLLAGRDEDVMALGVAWLNLSDEQARLDRELGQPETRDEWVIEWTYQWHVKPWWQLQPDLQYVVRPGGNGTLSDAWVAGLRTSLTF